MPLPWCTAYQASKRSRLAPHFLPGSFQATNCQELLELRKGDSAVVRIRVHRRLAINASALKGQRGAAVCMRACAFADVCCRLSPRLCKAWRHKQSLETFQHLRAEILPKTTHCQIPRPPRQMPFPSMPPLRDANHLRSAESKTGSHGHCNKRLSPAVLCCL